MHTLFENYQLAHQNLNNKFVMAPMTRCRSINNIPTDLVSDYYQQRATAGLIITEGASPSPNGLGYPRIPGAYSDAQVQGWKKVADAVHKEGGKIFVQLMHTGRIVGKVNLPEGAETLAPSAIQAAGEIFTETGMVAHDIPREMTLEDITQVQNEFVNSAKRLVNEAGIDGIELHAANGYLLNQFINPKSNQRTDIYGGSIANRIRFVVETAQKVADAIGAEKVGVRISPLGSYNDMQNEYPEVTETFTTLAKALKEIGIVYLHIVSQTSFFGNMDGVSDTELTLKKEIKKAFEGTVITGGDINNIDTAEAVLNQGFDLVYVGRPFISNPDFVTRLQEGKNLVAPDPETFFSASEKGYTDYQYTQTLA